jgi:hypothetical protein
MEELVRIAKDNTLLSPISGYRLYPDPADLATS